MESAKSFTLSILGREVRRLRLEKNKTLRDVRAETGVSLATLSRLEREVSCSVRSSTLHKLVEWTGVPYDVIFMDPPFRQQDVKRPPRGNRRDFVYDPAAGSRGFLLEAGQMLAKIDNELNSLRGQMRDLRVLLYKHSTVRAPSDFRQSRSRTKSTKPRSRVWR